MVNVHRSEVLAKKMRQERRWSEYTDKPTTSKGIYLLRPLDVLEHLLQEKVFLFEANNKY